MSNDRAVSRVRQAIETEPRIRTAGPPIEIEIDADGKLTMQGEMVSVAAKRLALGRAAALPDVIAVVDKLRVAPARRFSDEQIRRRLLDLLVDEPVFAFHELRGRTGAEPPVRPTSMMHGSGEQPRIEFRVSEGIVTLHGRVPSLEHKRLAGVLAWWVPGTRDVANALAVDPPEEDGDMEIAEGVRLAFEKDPIVNAPAIAIEVKEGVVHLRGAVAAREERDAAEADAWYVFGVTDVVNEIAAPE